MSSTPQEHIAWAAPGSDAAARDTYASIKAALQELTAARTLEVFLQGSYANATNIRADSDVDVVVMTRLTFRGTPERLSSYQRSRFDTLPPATFTAQQLRQEVTDALVRYYGRERVHPRDKCITVDGRNGTLAADVVPALQYRWYRTQNSDLTDFVEGILISPATGGQIVNFPKEHIKNGAAKNAQCSDLFKATVRQAKRLRNRAVDEGRIKSDAAPGYLLECMIYNVQVDRFVPDHSKRLSNLILALKYADKANFSSCDGIHYLFKTDPGGFQLATAQKVIDVLWDAY